MSSKRPQPERIVHTVTIGASGVQNQDAVGFRIEPPIVILDPNFMGTDVSFTYSDSTATYGSAKRPESTTKNEWRDIQNALRPVFEDGLQTFLGQTGLSMQILHGSGAEI